MFRYLSTGKRVIKHMSAATAGILTIAKFTSVTGAALSMLVSVAVYAAVFGIKFAVGFVLLIFFHELGHIIASNIVGLRSGGMIFVPFLGAAVNLRQSPVNARMDANIAIGGPAAGTLSALFCLLLYFWTDNMLLLLLAYTACLLNLFNLIPCAPLDGWRIAAAISPHLWLAGNLIVGIFAYYTQNIFMWFIFIFSLIRSFQGRQWEEEQGNYFTLTLMQRMTVACWYFILLTVLGVITVYLTQYL